MAERRDDIRTDLETLLAGGLDALEPEQVARLEAYLNADAASAERLADCQPPAPEARFRAASAEPTGEDWERVWRGIEGRLSAGGMSRGRLVRRLVWRPLLAAAALCALAVGLWRSASRPQVESWPVQWSDEVAIEEMHVYDDSLPLVLAARGDGTIPLIWVVEPGG